MNRREFLKIASLVPALTLQPLGNIGWAARVNDAAVGRKRLIVVFLRGAVDGLNLVIPYNESAYYDDRPSIAIPASGGDKALTDLDGQFGLHPALASLMPLWRERSLAFVHACGSPDATRSHFDAQDYMESGTPGVKSTPDGWMNRLLATLPGAHAPTQAVSFGPTLPRIFSGKMTVANVGVGMNASRPMPLDRPVVSAAFDRLYEGNDALSRAYREGQVARKQLLGDLQQDMEAASNGAPSASGFVQIADQAARLMARDRNIQLAFLAVGGWDTHVNQGASAGQLANHLKPLGDGLANLAHQLGDAYGDTAIIVMSEFGRTVRENGNGGTDHGHANVMWVMGGAVRGGKVYGKWPGLSGEYLYQGRDLAVTTDFRAVIDAVLAHHLGLAGEQRGRVFPGYRMGAPALAGLIA
ncbi:MAG: DUF1501 domain-containing protein [Sulfuricaulis sp.]